MAISKIPQPYRPVNIGYTGNTGSVTFQFPSSPRRAYLLFTSHGLYYLHWTSDTSDSVAIGTIWKNATVNPTVTDNGNWSVTISGLVWYSQVFALSGSV